MRERLSRRDGCVADKSVTSFRRCRRITGCWCIASPHSLVWSTTSTSRARPSLSTAAAPHECTSSSPFTVSESVCRLLPTRVVPDKGPLNGCVYVQHSFFHCQRICLSFIAAFSFRQCFFWYCHCLSLSLASVKFRLVLPF